MDEPETPVLAVPGTGPAGLSPFLKFDPNQPRVSAGHSDGGQWTDGGGGGSGSTFSGLNDDRVLSDATPDNFWKPGTELAQAEDGRQYRVDLHEHRKRGGHTLEEHVGKSDAYLLARVRGERGPVLVRKRAGSFPSDEAATKLVNSTLARNREIVDRVAKGELVREFITAEFGSITGREAFAPSIHSVPSLRGTSGVGVVIIHDSTVQEDSQ